MTRLMTELTEKDVKCLPAYCENLEVQSDGIGESGFEKTKFYCKKLKRLIGPDEYIKFPRGCPYARY